VLPGSARSRNGTDEHAAIDAEVARLLYAPHLAPDFAYVQILDFYELPPSKLLMTSSSLPPMNSGT